MARADPDTKQTYYALYYIDAYSIMAVIFSDFSYRSIENEKEREN